MNMDEFRPEFEPVSAAEPFGLPEPFKPPAPPRPPEPVFTFEAEKPKRSHAWAWAFGVVAVAAVLFLMVAYAILPNLQERFNNPPAPVATLTATVKPDATAGPKATGTPAAPQPTLDLGYNAPAIDQSNLLESLYDQVSGSVVVVNNYQSSRMGGEQLAGTGSGVVISKDGHIITNAHVVNDATKVTVVFNNNEEVEATVIGMDLRGDIAVLKVDYKNLVVASLGDSDEIKVGRQCVAIGNPDNLAGSMTVGYISGPVRVITTENNVQLSVLQISAAINPGNSGGGLFDMQGRLIGIPALKTISVGTTQWGQNIAAEGLGFAIPINAAINIASTIIEKGYFPRPVLGIEGMDVTALEASRTGFPEGVRVSGLIENGAAEKAGLQVYDIIIQFDGEPIKNLQELQIALAEHKPGDTVTVRVYRAGAQKDVSVTLMDSQ